MAASRKTEVPAHHLAQPYIKKIVEHRLRQPYAQYDPRHIPYVPPLARRS